MNNPCNFLLASSNYLLVNDNDFMEESSSNAIKDLSARCKIGANGVDSLAEFAC
jgi:hypothetical protein